MLAAIHRAVCDRGCGQYKEFEYAAQPYHKLQELGWTTPLEDGKQLVVCPSCSREVWTHSIIEELDKLGTYARSAYQPSEISIPIPGKGQVLATREFNRDGWEAVLEDEDREDQHPLLDGPDDPHAPAAVVAAWLDRLARDPEGNLA